MVRQCNNDAISVVFRTFRFVLYRGPFIHCVHVSEESVDGLKFICLTLIVKFVMTSRPQGILNRILQKPVSVVVCVWEVLCGYE